MPQYYRVIQGDYVTKIAMQYNYANYQTIWDHPANAQLRAKRKTPNVLNPGDILFIPDLQDKKVDRATGRSHVFTVEENKIRLRIVLENHFNQPFANAQCFLQYGSTLQNIISDGKGKIETEIAVSTEQATLVINDPGTPADGLTIPVMVGHLDPVDTPTGQVARLANLGYYLGDIENVDPAQMRSAVEEFQCDWMGGRSAVDGICGPSTQAKLREAHGC